MMAPPLNTGVVAGDEGVEPSSADLEAAMLPLHQSPLARSAGIEPATSRVEAGCSDPLSYERLARRVGFEPTTSGSEARRTIQLCYRRMVGGWPCSCLGHCVDCAGGLFLPPSSGHTGTLL
jgi:hypothetical protein